MLLDSLFLPYLSDTMPSYFLNESDRKLIQEFLEEARRGRVELPYRSRPYVERSWVEKADHQAPEIYVAQPQESSGIPALSGTVPGEAICDIYQIVVDGPNDPTLEQIGQFEKLVYNVGGVIGQVPILIARTKYGKWVPVVGGGTPCDFIRFAIDAVYQDALPYYATVDILSRPCGCTTVEEETEATGTGTGETILVYDMAGCFFDEPEVDLIDRVGYAKYMIDEDYESAIPVTGTGTDVGTGTGGGDCRWEVVHLCCPADCDPATGTP